ncbi:class I SAM-dependent methyltransferase [Parvibaculum sp.]|uniref:class I SAM-dependent methyltransferase n=1 Tax=Parvibaculum sp. TaxID=2024848 RepID=UPI00260273BA|nr:class I SAM-dependent methyltransferase [Parvibaculum sp.]MCW5726926.1 class I SAM-dependent methyltransferase [Parvibaculum sp.]
MNTSHSDQTTRGAKEIYLDKTYLENNPTWHVEDSPWKAQQIRLMLCRHNIAANTICEIGCGAGEVLKQLSWEYPTTQFFGYELSPDAYELCKTRETQSVKYFMENLLVREEKFDVLLCIDVFEHVEDYIGFLKSLKSKATYKVFHIPLDITVSAVLRNTMISARQKVGHLHYFTQETALATLRDSGYEIVDYFFTRSFDGLPSRSLKSKIAKLPRKILYMMSPNLMVKLLGGCSLLVLTK